MRARRTFAALVLVGSVLFPTLACTGTATDGTTPPVPAPAPVDHSKKILGNWRMGKSEEEARRLKVIDAAISEKPAKREKLGDLTPDEQALFDEWRAKKEKKDPACKEIRQEIRYVRGSQFHFTDTKVSAEFGGDEAFKDIPYKVKSATESQLTLEFDPGLGNGLETHVITWSSATEGTDTITGSAGKTFEPLALLRIK